MKKRLKSPYFLKAISSYLYCENAIDKKSSLVAAAIFSAGNKTSQIFSNKTGSSGDTKKQMHNIQMRCEYIEFLFKLLAAWTRAQPRVWQQHSSPTAASQRSGSTQGFTQKMSPTYNFSAIEIMRKMYLNRKLVLNTFPFGN